MKKLLMSTLFLGLILSSCSDDEAEEMNSPIPVITINQPTDGSTFSVGDQMPFSFNATDDVDITTITYGALGFISGTITGLEGDSDTDVFLDDTVLIDADIMVGTYTFVMEVTDSDGNRGSDSVEVTIE